MQIQEIINHIAAGESVAAKESIENVLSAKAFDALQGRKQEMAATIFGGQEQSHEEVTDDEEAYAEDVEHDGEQLDELSKSTLSSYEKKAHDSLQKAVDSKHDAKKRANVILISGRGGGSHIDYHDKRKAQLNKAKKTIDKRMTGLQRSWNRTTPGLGWSDEE